MGKIIAVLDTNIIVSALVFGGNPRTVFQSVVQNQMIGVTSPFLLAELNEVLTKKFKFSRSKMKLIEIKIKKKFMVVNPGITIDVLDDSNPDNRVLEAAVVGNCHYIITGDSELLDLKAFQGVNIVTAVEFLAMD